MSVLIEQSANCVIDMCTCSERSGYLSGQGRIRPTSSIPPTCTSWRSHAKRLCRHIIQYRRCLLRQDLGLSLRTATPAFHPEIFPLVSVAPVTRISDLLSIYKKFREDCLPPTGASARSCYSSPFSQFLRSFWCAFNASQSAESGKELWMPTVYHYM